MKTTLAILTSITLTGITLAEPIIPPVPLYGVPPEIARQLTQQMRQVEGQLQRQMVIDPLGPIGFPEFPDLNREEENAAVRFSSVNGVFTWKKSNLKETFIVTGMVGVTGPVPSRVQWFDGQVNRKFEAWADVPEDVKVRIMAGLKPCTEVQLP